MNRAEKNKLRDVCLRHRRYPSQQVAMACLAQAMAEWGTPLKRAYECSFCRGWHLTCKAYYHENQVHRFRRNVRKDFHSGALFSEC